MEDAKFAERIARNLACSRGLECPSQQNTIPLYHCRHCDCTVCASCAMTYHVDRGHKCCKLSRIREELAVKLNTSVSGLNKFLEDDLEVVATEMENLEQSLSNDQTELRKLCVWRNNLEARAKRMKKDLDVSASSSGIHHIGGTVSVLNNICDETSQFSDTWNKLRHRISSTWHQAERRVDTSVGIFSSSHNCEKVYKGSVDAPSVSSCIKNEKDFCEDQNSTSTEQKQSWSCGDLVWARTSSKARYWAGMVLKPGLAGTKETDGKVTVYLFGYNRLQVTPTGSNVISFEKNFFKVYNGSEKVVPLYYTVGVEEALKEAMRRKGKVVSDEIKEDELFEWAQNGFPYFLPLYVEELLGVIKKNNQKSNENKKRKLTD